MILHPGPGWISRTARARRFLGLALAAALAAAVLAGGCNRVTVHLKEEYFINPDGSGKVQIDARYREMEDNGTPIPRERFELIDNFKVGYEKSRGYDSVRDVTIAAGADGWNHYKFTVYFTDLNRLIIQNVSLVGFQWKWTPGEKGARLEVRYLPMERLTRNLDRSIAHAYQEKTEGEWADKQVKEFSKDYPEILFKGWRIEQIVHLPGKAEAPTGLTVDGPTRVRILITDRQLIDAFRAVFVEDVLGEMVSVRNSGPGRRRASRILFKTESGLAAGVSGPQKPLFDYKKEAAAAKADFPALLEKLGITVESPP